MSDTMISVIEEALVARSEGVDMVHFAWIGPLTDQRWAEGMASIQLTGVPWKRVVFWSETQNYEVARERADKLSRQLRVMRMRDLYRYWQELEGELAIESRHVYASLKRLDAMAAAKDLASLCILHVVGGYFFDASVKFIDFGEVIKLNAKLTSDKWMSGASMPVLPVPTWCGDAWALYSAPNSLATRDALTSYRGAALKAGFQRRHPQEEGIDRLIGLTDPKSAFERVGALADLIMVALALGWKDRRTRQGFSMVGDPTVAEFEQRQLETEFGLIYLLPELGLSKLCGSSTYEQDPSKWTGWKAKPLRDWSTKNTY